MFKNRFNLALGVLSLLLSTLAFAKPVFKLSPARSDEATDFYQPHPDWAWAIKDQNASIPVTGASAFPDYYQRHPELTVSSILGLDASDYFMRHPELTVSADASVDLTDYYFRHAAALPSATNIDLTDYFFRHP